MTVGSSLARMLWPTASLNLSWRKLLYRQLCKGEQTPDFPFTTDFFGLKYEGNLNNSIEANILFYGAFEKPLLFFLKDAWINLSNDMPESRKPPVQLSGANMVTVPIGVNSVQSSSSFKRGESSNKTMGCRKFASAFMNRLWDPHLINLHERELMIVDC